MEFRLDGSFQALVVFEPLELSVNGCGLRVNHVKGSVREELAVGEARVRRVHVRSLYGGTYPLISCHR